MSWTGARETAAIKQFQEDTMRWFREHGHKARSQGTQDVLISVSAVMEDAPDRDWTLRQIQEMCPRFNLSQINDAVWRLLRRGQVVRVNGKQSPVGRAWNPDPRLYRYVRKVG